MEEPLVQVELAVAVLEKRLVLLREITVLLIPAVVAEQVAKALVAPILVLMAVPAALVSSSSSAINKVRHE
jgi:hypothetical protein